jgi:PAS domain S-box-containing protein
MMPLHIRELKYAMSTSGVSFSSHLIAILMSPTGRFVVCIDCHLSVEFPAGAHYDIVARRFESHSCRFPRLLKDDAHSGKTITAHARTSEASSRFDFDSNSNPMWVFDNTTFACSAVNDAAIHEYGYSRKEFLSMTIRDIRSGESTVPLSEEMSHQEIHDSAKILWKHKKKDGSVIDVEITRSEVLFDGCIADIVTAVDVTGDLLAPKSA